MIRNAQEAAPNWTVPEFIAWLNDHANLETPPATGVVTLATMHVARGLEWDVVIVAGVREGMVPFVLSQEGPTLSGKRRLLHVAVAWARRRLRVLRSGKSSRD